jgi:hypothetical protein
MSQIISKDLGYPFLKAKAAQVRHLAEFGLALAYKHAYGAGARQRYSFANNSPMVPKTRQRLDLLVTLFQRFERYTRLLSASEFDETGCKTAMLQYLASLSALNKLWREGRSLAERKRCPFHIRPKCHLLQHLVLDHIQRYGSPAKFWCYRDEDYVGYIKRICSF